MCRVRLCGMDRETVLQLTLVVVSIVLAALAWTSLLDLFAIGL